MANKYIHNINGNEVPFTEEEITARKAEEAEATNGAKLKQIKQIRLQKLKETDWYSNSDVTMPDNIKTWRQSLRDLPANHTNETAYDTLLARDSDGKLTHSVWTQPTS
jgi:hypothetical protein